MTLKTAAYFTLFALFVTCLGFYSLTLYPETTGAVEPNMQARIQRMATTSVGVYSVATIASEVSAIPCASRVITTGADVMLSFDGDFSPTASIGHLQSGTTTKEYDAAIYGCGAIRAISRSATNTISVSTFIF